ncbi:MAG TPA: sigma-70 family RNA polymerase sigma factor [Vicinamibacterales bacterium]|nr:sigma-70 family RNA polymerase sigma factor [Vicinamibacterales bacterium]
MARELAVAVTAEDATAATVDLDYLFDTQFTRITRVIARVTRDPSRAEELAVDVFLKWVRTPSAQGPHAVGWLYRTAMHMGLNELRGETRRQRYERIFALLPARRTPVKTPQDIYEATQARDQVRLTLSALPRRQAALLVLRSDDMSYGDIAAALGLNPASIGTLLARAYAAFQKEYVKRYGHA